MLREPVRPPLSAGTRGTLLAEHLPAAHLSPNLPVARPAPRDRPPQPGPGAAPRREGRRAGRAGAAMMHRFRKWLYKPKVSGPVPPAQTDLHPSARHGLSPSRAAGPSSSPESGSVPEGSPSAVYGGPPALAFGLGAPLSTRPRPRQPLSLAPQSARISRARTTACGRPLPLGPERTLPSPRLPWCDSLIPLCPPPPSLYPGLGIISQPRSALRSGPLPTSLRF